MCLKCESGSSRFQPGEGPSRGLLRDYEPSDGTFWSTTGEAELRLLETAPPSPPLQLYRGRHQHPPGQCTPLLQTRGGTFNRNNDAIVDAVWDMSLSFVLGHLCILVSWPPMHNWFCHLTKSVSSVWWVEVCRCVGHRALICHMSRVTCHVGSHGSVLKVNNVHINIIMK